MSELKAFFEAQRLLNTLPVETRRLALVALVSELPEQPGPSPWKITATYNEAKPEPKPKGAGKWISVKDAAEKYGRHFSTIYIAARRAGMFRRGKGVDRAWAVNQWGKL